MDNRIERLQRLPVAEDDVGQIAAVKHPVAIGFLPETGLDGLAQRPGHQPLGGSVAVVDRNTARGKEAADRTLAASDSSRYSDLYHCFCFFSGMSISGMRSMEMILMSLNFTDRAFCSDWGSMMIFPSWPSSREGSYLSSESGTRDFLRM